MGEKFKKLIDYYSKLYRKTLRLRKDIFIASSIVNEKNSFLFLHTSQVSLITILVPSSLYLSNTQSAEVFRMTFNMVK